MKRSIMVGLMLLICITSTVTISCYSKSEAEVSPVKPYGVEVVAYEPGTDYMSLMVNCVEEGTENALALGAIYEEQRNMKIEDVGSDEEPTRFFYTLDAENIADAMREYIGKPETETAMHYTEDEVEMVAKVLYRECRGIPSDTEKACVAWTICNRVGAEGFQDTISDVIKHPGAFAYVEDTPVTEELYALASDVLKRWNAEKNGETDVGRVLPVEYMYFSGDGKHNHFRNAYKGSYDIWTYGLPTPYES